MQTDDFAQTSTEHCMTGLLTQHALRALNVPISSADAEAECALNSYRPITNWCVLTDSLSEESVKELCSAAWNGDLYVGLKRL